ncbi:30S ribosomal protein PSRP-3 [Geminocystis sp. NIES-3709]|uniref:30S ribosomal protein PSRP-3 n=1 Tax=Geminocystis sp. NIES-3709 TaxID=1617448 RepID=UPI0005FC6323|nr:30S ribosomal protein PSRP-3 [Geminocystis sp. NIES-3709]BAQ66399.1 plastid and cyanobacterial ribosome-associated protein PSRP-3 [Geminocystis sp. NIES-3709]
MESAVQTKIDSRFVLKVVWLDKDVALAVDYVISKGTSPLTPYYFWPRSDAWQELKDELDKKNWITDHEKIELLNQATEVINFWQEKGRVTSMLQAQQKFPSVVFSGTN